MSTSQYRNGRIRTKQYVQVKAQTVIFSGAASTPGCLEGMSLPVGSRTLPIASGMTLMVACGFVRTRTKSCVIEVNWE